MVLLPGLLETRLKETEVCVPNTTDTVDVAKTCNDFSNINTHEYPKTY